MTKQPKNFGLANHEIVTLVVCVLGGSTHVVDTEDVAVKVNELAPGRFTWRKHKDQISLDAVSKGLWDAKSEKKGYQYLTGSEREGWMLSRTGVAFSEKNIHRLGSDDLSRDRISESDKRWLRRERVRLLTSDAFGKFRDDRADTITPNDATNFFRIDEYVTGSARDRKIARIVNAFYQDPELGPALKVVAAIANEGAPE